MSLDIKMKIVKSYYLPSLCFPSYLIVHSYISKFVVEELIGS